MRAVMCLLAVKVTVAYHLVIGGGQLWTPLLATPTAPEALHGSGQVREAWTDVGKNAVVRRACLGRSDKFSQVSVHASTYGTYLGVDPATVPYGEYADRGIKGRSRVASLSPRLTRLLGPGLRLRLQLYAAPEP